VPSPSLIDFDAIDLSKVVVPMEEVRKVCKQRGRLELLHGILHFDVEGELIVGYRDVRSDEWWAADHLPGRPIFPGVLQIEGAAQLCTYDFIHRRPDLENKFVGYGGLNETRFRGVVEPDCRLVWAGKIRKMRSTMFAYYAQAFVGRKLVFETEILGVIV
jgi:3-hydroxyacyl-[acyl-carrier-protein] dehydratase